MTKFIQNGAKMKKIALSVIPFFALCFATHLYAADTTVQDKTSPPAAPAAPAEVKTEAEPITPAPASAAAETKSEEAKTPEKGSENLEFVSGEVSAVEEATKTVTIKLYGETEQSKSDKVISVKVNESRDITDGEADRDLKSLTAGTEVDVEYDPTTNIATYIFVY